MGESGWGSGLAGYSSSGHGVYAQSSGGGINGAALYANNTQSVGIALMAQNNTTTETTMLVENDGTGDLLKGFGGDSGDDEFRFTNDGTFQDKAPSYVFIPASELKACNWSVLNLVYWVGKVEIYTSSTGVNSVCIYATLPAVLYGQPVEIEEIRIYYDTMSSLNFIDNTQVRLDDSGLFRTLIDDPSDFDSTVIHSYYDEYPTRYNRMHADRGLITILLDIYYKDTSQSVSFYGARFKLRHHPLY